MCYICAEGRERRGKPQNIGTDKNTSAESTQFRPGQSTEMSIKILQLNVDCLTSKIEELKRFIKQHEIDVFLLQETKLVKSDRTPRFPGFTIERRDREQPKGKEKDRRGGLIIGIKNTIPYKYMSKTNIRGGKIA